MDTPRVTLRCPFCGSWNRIDTSRAADRPTCGQCSKPMLLDRPVTLDDETFERTINASEVPILVDFYAEWCPPCKQMAPYVDAVAAKYIGRALVAKVDTDRAPQIAQQFGIRGIPTTIVFDHGREVGRQVGAVPQVVLEQLVNQPLSQQAATRAPGAVPSSAG
jgi:thioredoxin 2